MDITSYLPPLQATLNTISACLIMAAYYYIRRGKKRAHKTCMVSALVVSTLFLISYLYYHTKVGYVPFSGQGFIRPIYFLILFSHILLAVVILPMIVLTVTFALRDRITLHQRMTRWTLPLWLYVSVTGVLIYLFGFHLYPPQV
jgi:putative membrane protein